MFWAIEHKTIDLEGLSFRLAAEDTASLNERASRGDGEVIAVSSGALPVVSKHYMVLPHGASVGRGFGPKLVSKRHSSLGDLKDKVIAIPGQTTTAATLLRLVIPNVKTKVVPISPFEAVFQQLDDGEVDAAVIIHEGQLLYEEFGAKLILDLGTWWEEQYCLPIPLGVNVIKRDLGSEIPKVSRVIEKSIQWAAENKETVVQSLLKSDAPGSGNLSDSESLSRYLSMYANDDTCLMDENCKKAIKVLLEESSVTEPLFLSDSPPA